MISIAVILLLGVPAVILAQAADWISISRKQQEKHNQRTNQNQQDKNEHQNLKVQIRRTIGGTTNNFSSDSDVGIDDRCVVDDDRWRRGNKRMTFNSSRKVQTCHPYKNGILRNNSNIEVGKNRRAEA